MSDNFMPHGHCYQWQPEILWPIVAGEALHVIAYAGLAGMLFFLCTRQMSNGVSWMPPFLFLFACFIFTCGVSHAINIWTIWNPDYRLQAFWDMVSGTVSLATLAATIHRRAYILPWLGVGASKLFPSRSYDKPSDCSECINLITKLKDKNDG